MRSRQEGPEEAILNRFSTDEIVTVIGVVACMVAAVAVTVAQIQLLFLTVFVKVPVVVKTSSSPDWKGFH